MGKEKTKTKKYIRNFMLFSALVAVTFYILLKDQNMNELVKTLFTVKPQFLLIAVCCMIVYFLCESINLRRTLLELRTESYNT